MSSSKDILDQIRGAVIRHRKRRGHPPATLCIGSENYARYLNHPMIQGNRRYSAPCEPWKSRCGKTTFEGVEILCAPTGPAHLRAVGSGRSSNPKAESQTL